MAERKNEVGNRYGRLRVVSYAGTNCHNALWNCVCDCGNKCVKLGVMLRSGRTKSCGCLHSETLSKRNKKYNVKYPRRLYHSWHCMIERCEKEDNRYYYNYGGRGISVCEEWHNFEVFATWALQNGYDESKTIDRINNDGNYCPENCKWSTKREQENNKRTNRKVEINGDVLNLSEWCEIFGISQVTVQSRLRYGWDIVDAITTPVPKRRIILCIETGETFRFASEAGKKYGVSASSISMAASGRTKSSCGFHWKYIDE